MVSRKRFWILISLLGIEKRDGWIDFSLHKQLLPVSFFVNIIWFMLLSISMNIILSMYVSWNRIQRSLYKSLQADHYLSISLSHCVSFSRCK